MTKESKNNLGAQGHTHRPRRTSRRNDVGTISVASNDLDPVVYTGVVKIGFEFIDIQFIKREAVPSVDAILGKSHPPPDFVIFELPEDPDISEEYWKNLEFAENLGVVWQRQRDGETLDALDISFDLGVLGRHPAQGLPKEQGGDVYRICVNVPTSRDRSEMNSRSDRP